MNVVGHDGPWVPQPAGGAVTYQVNGPFAVLDAHSASVEHAPSLSTPYSHAVIGVHGVPFVGTVAGHAWPMPPLLDPDPELPLPELDPLPDPPELDPLPEPEPLLPELEPLLEPPELEPPSGCAEI